MTADCTPMTADEPRKASGRRGMRAPISSILLSAGIGGLSAGIGVPAVAQAQLFKCVQNGKTVYQQEKCPDEAKQSTVRCPDAVPEKPLDAKAAAEKAQQEAAAEKGRILDVFAGYTICAEKFPDFGSRYGPAFEDWKVRNAAAFGRFNADPANAQRLEQRLREERVKPFPEDTPGRLAACTPTITAIQPGRGTR